MQTRRLLILRHADAGWDSPSDFERPLNTTGLAKATEVAKWLIQANLIPDHLLCSTARRAYQTADQLISQFPKHPLTVQHLQSLYLASPETMLKALGQLPSTVNSAIIVAHNPGLEQLLCYLSKTNPRVSGRALLAPANLAHLSIDCDWSELTPQCGELVTIFAPSQHA